MAISKVKIINNILRKTLNAGMAIKFEGKDSQTTILVKAIVDEIIDEIVRDGEVIVLKVNSMGTGNQGAPVSSKITGRGKGIIK